MLRIDQGLALAHLEVEVLALRDACIAAVTEQLSLHHDITLFDEELVEVAVQGLEAAAVLDDDMVAVGLPGLAAGEDHAARRRRENGGVFVIVETDVDA